MIVARQNGAAIHINGGHIGAQHAHQTAGHVFVAASYHHHTIHPLTLHAGFNAVADNFAADQAVLHAFGPHGHAVADGGGAKHLGIASGFQNSGNGRIRQFLQSRIARCDRAVTIGHTHHGFAKVTIFVAHAVVHGPVGRAGLAFGDVGGAELAGWNFGVHDL